MANDIDRDELLDALRAIDVEGTDHETWSQVGMALHHEGCPFEDFDAWSSADTRPGQYSRGGCMSAWRSFHDDGPDPITGRYIFKLARDAGWRPAKGGLHAFGLNDAVTITAPAGTSPATAGAPRAPDDEPADPAAEVSRFLSALFGPDEYICTVVSRDSVSKGDDGRWRPSGQGKFYKRRGEVTGRLDRDPSSMERVLGTPEPEAGAWVCINPLDGRGRGNGNVTAFRYALVESDDMPIEEQLRKLEELRLPVATIVTSGNKSVHALVRVDAADRAQYRERVEGLYDWLESNGMSVDRQNSNPSRLSRLPGYKRGDHWQRLVQVGPFEDGCRDWADFDAWRNGSELPPIEWCWEVQAIEEQRPELVHGILRDGQKLVLSGPSKSGKSFAMAELAIAVSRGWEWLGHECEQGTVLYINLEIDRPTMQHRLLDAYRILKERHGEYTDGEAGGDRALFNELRVGLWNLRGHGEPLDELAPRLIKEAKRSGVDIRLLIIDPIYKVLTGDENSAADVGRMCNQFDHMAEELGCAVAYAHHHSKAAMGYASSMDRASGSSVFARDPDAILDMSEIEVPDDRSDLVTRDDGRVLRAYRIEATLREFEEPDPVDVLFDYPLHVEVGGLEGLRTGKGGSRPGYDWDIIRSLMAECLDDLDRSGSVAVGPTVKDWMKHHGGETANLIATQLDNWLKPRNNCHEKFGYERSEPLKVIAPIEGDET